VTLILSVDMNDDVSIETHIKYDKLVILRKKKKKVTKETYLKFVQNLKTIFLKLKTQKINKIKI
jgi:hypothetical protein